MQRKAIAVCVGALFQQADAQRSAGSSNVDPQRITAVQSKAETNKVKAGFSGEAYGKGMAKAYLLAVGEATSTWQEGVVFLLKSTNDKQREEAMTSAMKIAADYDDETASANLKKRISEARRVFKAASVKGHAEVLAIFEGKGSWHQKVAKLPKASTKGRKKDQGAGKTTKQDQRKALVAVIGGEDVAKALPKKVLDNVVSFVEKQQAKAAKVARDEVKADVDKRSTVAQCVDILRTLNFDQARQVLDVALFSLSQSPNSHTKAAALQAMGAFDAADKANATTLERKQA